MNRLIPIFVGAIAILAFATLMLVVIPGAQIRDQAPAPGLADVAGAPLTFTMLLIAVRA